jgi:hypothetical protein
MRCRCCHLIRLDRQLTTVRGELGGLRALRALGLASMPWAARSFSAIFHWSDPCKVHVTLLQLDQSLGVIQGKGLAAHG